MIAECSIYTDLGYNNTPTNVKNNVKFTDIFVLIVSGIASV